MLKQNKKICNNIDKIKKYYKIKQHIKRKIYGKSYYLYYDWYSV